MHATTLAAAEHPQLAPAPVRRRPGVRSGYTLDFAVGDLTATLTANARDDGTLREIFIHTGKHGSTLAGLLDTIATTVSIGLRNGVPLQNYVDHLADLAFIPNGPTDDPDITRAASVTDYLFRRLAIDFLRPGTT
jgi:ribonucleoside-diphosphate reductase alpha chain